MNAQPSPSLIAQLRTELVRMPPFSRMPGDAVDFFIIRSEQRYFAPQDTLLSPQDGPVRELFYLRQGVVAEEELGESEAQVQAAIEHEAGELFPLDAVTQGRAVRSRFRAAADTFVLTIPVEAMRELTGRCEPFADFLSGRMESLLQLSQHEQQWAATSKALAEQSFETRLGDLAHRAPVTCSPDTPLRDALQLMHAQHIGSILVTDASGQLAGILTRSDVLARVVLPETRLDVPISQVMVSPVHSLTAADTVQDAALAMVRHGIRHIPVTREQAVVSIVSERDLFALQRQSIKDISATIRRATDMAGLAVSANSICQFARTLLGQGIQARQLTELISHLNDVLTQRLLQIESERMGVDLSSLSWLALGSEGRSEQTIATDQDNAVILPDDVSEDDRRQIIHFARSVNQALDLCGYPLCKGNVMAGSPGGALTLREWRERFSTWIRQGSPQDLLSASIYFDFRCIAGQSALADALKADVVASARQTPRFLKQMALNALNNGVALTWLGGLDADRLGMIDLKMRGASVFVDAARILALAQGLTPTSTRERLQSIGQAIGLAQKEFDSWVSAFEFIQALRLRAQLQSAPEHSAAVTPNHLAVASLSDIDRRILKESLRVGRSLQQRLQLDYAR